jgi:4-hydroxybenzoate polyprenyltransferase
MEETVELRTAGSTFRAYLELLRLPNVFTAIADVMMGYLVVNRSFDPDEPVLMLAIISTCLYLAGMVYNDLFDRFIDAEQRPERPIPSGRVSANAARWLGAILLCMAIALAVQVGWILQTQMPYVVAICLAALILLYNKWLKHTLLGPVAMGGCRTLNVLLGMSATAVSLKTLDWTIAAGVGVYVAGITIFARHEERISDRRMLIGGLAVMLAGMGTIYSVPWLATGDWRLGGLDYRWSLFWALIAGQIAFRCGHAIAIPSPERVRAAVTNCIISIIVIDAAASLATVGVPIFSMAILVLIVPATLLGRWLNST